MHIQGGQATGIDSIPGEAFKALGWETVLILRDLFERRANDEDVDLVHWAWYQVLVWCIPKIALPKGFDEWRPMSLLSSMQKLYSSCLASILEATIDIPRTYTFGFAESA